MASAPESLPLVVDLDGTLIRTDMLHESTLQAVRDNPSDLVRIPFWLAQGKAQLKQKLAEQIQFDPTTLPYHAEFLNWLRQEHARGRRLILCTASDQHIAQPIADHLGLFAEVIASDGSTNLAGERKAAELVRRFGEKQFDYAGNAPSDLRVWQQARHAIVVNAPATLTQQAQACCKLEQTFPAAPFQLRTWRRLLRIHQWLKNALLFVPIFAAHQFTNAQHWSALLLAFLAFSLCASSVYIANDLTDLENDRHHPRKRNRPFASGAIALWKGVLVAPLLLSVGLVLAYIANPHFLPWLCAYFLLTCAYSWGLKRLVLVDCLTLAILYTLRIVAGAATVNMSLSFWLLAFSAFLFLSLAFVKRYAELQVQALHNKIKTHGRGYLTSDAPLIQMLGVASGFAAIMVLALYLQTEAVLQLYHTPEVVWMAVVVVLFWISWMWLQAHRGEMHDDPVVFAIKDKTSLIAGVFFVLVMFIGTIRWPW